MIPAASCPSSIGVGRTRLPSTTDKSEWQTPAASMRTSSSSAPGGASATSAMVIGRDCAYGRGDSDLLQYGAPDFKHGRIQP